MPRNSFVGFSGGGEGFLEGDWLYLFTDWGLNQGISGAESKIETDWWMAICRAFLKWKSIKTRHPPSLPPPSFPPCGIVTLPPPPDGWMRMAGPLNSFGAMRGGVHFDQMKEWTRSRDLLRWQLVTEFAVGQFIRLAGIAHNFDLNDVKWFLLVIHRKVMSSLNIDSRCYWFS